MNDELGGILIALARGAIAARLGLTCAAAAHHAALDQPGATFVTLTRDGELRGCIGTLEAHRPLGVDVRENAIAAAFRDPRFAPLTAAEYPETRVEVSLLTAPQVLTFSGEADALAQLRPRVDGVILMHDCHRATFLPQVWESLPEPQQFLAQLKRKAGLPPDFWDDAVMLARYEVTKWKEDPAWAA